MNDFGSQLEVSAHSSFSKNQKSVCDMERLVCQAEHHVISATAAQKKSQFQAPTLSGFMTHISNSERKLRTAAVDSNS